VQCGSAVAAAAVEWLWLGSRLSAAQAALAALTLGGVAIGLMGPMGPMTPRRPRSDFVAGVVLAGISACAQGGSAVISRKAFAVLRSGGFFMDGATSAYQRALGGLAVAVLALIVVRLWPARRRPPVTEAGRVPATAMPPWAWVLLNTLLGPVLGVTCYQWALRSNPAGLVLPIVATAPLLTVPIARALELARPTPRYWLGAVLAVAGAAGLAVAR
jgi:drug/metabolite transporter (DMT)-like permease